MSRLADQALDGALLEATRASLLQARDSLALLKPDSSWSRLCREVDPGRGIRNLLKERLDGAEAEAHAELAKRMPGDALTTNSILLPYSTIAARSARLRMQRDAVAGTTTAGGYLAATSNFPNEAQALLSMLCLGGLGATGVDSTGPNLNLPLVTGSSAAYWMEAETGTPAQITESDQSFGQTAFSPHTVGGYTQMSRLLLLQSNAADVVANDLRRRLKRAIETAVFTGSGSGQLKGLVGRTGVSTATGASFTLATAIDAVTDVGDALTDDANPGWATNRSVAALLRQRQEFTNSSFSLWRGSLTWGRLADELAASTSGLGSGYAIFGCWAFLILMSWGGLQVDVNPYANFQQGIVGMRVLATLDAQPVWPSAFTTLTAVT